MFKAIAAFLKKFFLLNLVFGIGMCVGSVIGTTITLGMYGLPDTAIECSQDTDGDGVFDSVDLCRGGDDTIDTDRDGISDFCDICDGNDLIDNNNNGIPDACEVEDGS